MRYNLVWISGILLGILAALAGALAQDRSTPMVISSEVQTLIEAQDWRKAEKKLEDDRAKCGATQAEKSCGVLLNYSEGVLLQTRSVYDKSQRSTLLNASADAYRKVLREEPGQEAAAHNLAVVLGRLGDTAGLERLYEQNETKSPQLAATISVTLGDVHDASGDWDKAYTAYARAVDLAPLDDSAKLRMVASFADVSGGSDQLMSKLGVWEIQAPDIAARGYAAIFQKEGGESTPAANEAIVHWVSQAAASRQISRERVAEAFGKFDAQPVRELMDFLGRLEMPVDSPMPSPGEMQSFLHSGPRIIDETPWWRETRERRHALAEAALATGRTTTANGNAVQAQYQFLVGLQTAPDMLDYLSSPPPGSDFAPLELITELAWLQYRNPEVLDPGRSKLREIIDLIIESKGMAYEARDYRAIQRHHTLLGEIFAAEDAWTGGSYGFDNAIFQLSGAIRAARQREETEGFYQPQANVKAQLAAGYHVAPQEGDEKAARIAAVLAALDSDDLKLAQDQLSALDEVAANDRPKELTAILRARAAAFETRVDSEKSDASVRKPPSWAMADTISGVDAPTLRRQKFKLLADIAVAAEIRKNQQAAKKYAQAALAAARGVSTLIGTEDVLRLERIATILTGGIVSPDQPPLMTIAPSGRKPDRERGEWFLVLPSSDLPFIASFPVGPLADLARAPG